MTRVSDLEGVSLKDYNSRMDAALYSQEDRKNAGSNDGYLNFWKKQQHEGHDIFEPSQALAQRFKHGKDCTIFAANAMGRFRDQHASAHVVSTYIYSKNIHRHWPQYFNSYNTLTSIVFVIETNVHGFDYPQEAVAAYYFENVHWNFHKRCELCKLSYHIFIQFTHVHLLVKQNEQ